MGSIEQLLEGLFVGKLPPMSASAKETTAKVIPWVIIVFNGLGLLMCLSSLRFILGLSAFDGYLMPSGFMMVTLIISVVISLIGIYSGYLMLSRKRQGWLIALYMLLISFIMNVLSINIIGLVLSFVFAYLLFQTKESYNN